MSDKDAIKRAMTGLVEELTRAESYGEEPDFGKVIAPVSQLAIGFLIDTNRIANALEKLSTFKVIKVGEITLAQTEPEIEPMEQDS